jgi:hypothetical protein
LYQFVNRNPVNFLDPLGEWFLVGKVWYEATAERVKIAGRQRWVPRARPRVSLSLYSNAGQLLSSGFEALAQGTYKNVEDLGRRDIANGDTRFGVYLTGPEGGGPPFDVVDLRKLEEAESPSELTALGYELHKQAWSEERRKSPESYGLGVLNLHPIVLEAAARGKRNSIRAHGGGKSLGVPEAFEKCQPLTPTQGCLRLANQDIIELIRLLTTVARMPGEKRHGVVVLGDTGYFSQLENSAESALLEANWKSEKVQEKTGLSLDTLKSVLNRLR